MKWVMLMYVFIIGLLIANLSFGNSALIQKDYESGERGTHATQLRRDLENGRILDRTDKALDNLIITAVGELKKRGFQSLALSIESDWNSRYRGFVYEMVFDNRPIGDHPGITWMLSVHEKIEGALGETLCKALRLHDIYILAHTIPVVIRCIDNVDALEYTLHFIPFCGIIGYWISYGVCVGATLGSGVAFACGLIGMGVEMVVVRFVAPPLSPKAFARACG